MLGFAMSRFFGSEGDDSTVRVCTLFDVFEFDVNVTLATSDGTGTLCVCSSCSCVYIMTSFHSYCWF